MRNLFAMSVIVWIGFMVPGYAVEFSGTNNGVYVAIAGWRHTTNGGFVDSPVIRCDDKLVWCPFSTKGNTEVVYPLPEFGIKIRMVGPDGRDVRKTGLGKRFGSKWDTLRTMLDSKPGTLETQGQYDSRGGGFSGPLLPSPKDLFFMREPGIHTLEIQFQMFQRSGASTVEDTSKSLFRLGPIKIRVNNPASRDPSEF